MKFIQNNVTIDNHFNAQCRYIIKENNPFILSCFKQKYLYVLTKNALVTQNNGLLFSIFVAKDMVIDNTGNKMLFFIATNLSSLKCKLVM